MKGSRRHFAIAPEKSAGELLMAAVVRVVTEYGGAGPPVKQS
ncbi:hypothetical protein ACFCXK_04770 [Streptomyces sp. NPDC056269]